MNKLAIALAAASAAFCTTFAFAQGVTLVSAAPIHGMTYNLSVSSDYRFRGLSQSRLKPAVSASADYIHSPSGFYAGTWMSTIKWTKDLGGSGNVEVDIYAGKRGQLVPGISYDIGVLSYIYPSNNLPTNANTTELYGQLGYGPTYIKYSHAVNDAFGTPNSKGSGYLDVGANYNLSSDLVLNLHAGRQYIKNNNFYSYNDYKIGVTQDFRVATGSLAVVGTNAKNGAYPTPSGKDNGKTGLVATLGKSF